MELFTNIFFIAAISSVIVGILMFLIMRVNETKLFSIISSIIITVTLFAGLSVGGAKFIATHGKQEVTHFLQEEKINIDQATIKNNILIISIGGDNILSEHFNVSSINKSIKYGQATIRYTYKGITFTRTYNDYAYN